MKELESLQKKIEHLCQKTSISSSIDYFLKSQSPPYLYFKWRPDLCALKLTHSSPASSQEVVRLYESSSSFKLSQLEKDPMKIESVARLVQRVTGCQKMFHFPLHIQQEPLGLFFLSHPQEDTPCFLQYLEMKCESLASKEESKKLSGNDYFLQKLFSEISRARRVRLPVTAVIIRAFTQYHRGEEENLPLFFKSLRNHIIKNSQIYDSVIPLCSHELGLILPCTDEKHALERATKIDQTLNSLDHKDIFLNSKVYFQIGVAEYPKVARSAVDILKMARLSCSYKPKSHGLGGVCLASPIENFKPDFSFNENLIY